MNNRKIYPFKRNNYYYGKLFAVRDFEDEQKYFNDKRRLGNILTNGIGIVGGLSVIAIDDKTISVEAGMALDCMGREIIVEEAVTKKLNVIEGFEALKDDKDAFLCIEYADLNDEPVYSIIKGAADADDKSEFNRIKEHYTLRLTNEPLTEKSVMEELAVFTCVIYDGDGITITLTAPKLVTQNNLAVFRVKIEKTKFIKNLETDFYIRADNFMDENGDRLIHVFYRESEPSSYGVTELTYTLEADNIQAESEILIEGGTIVIGGVVNKTSRITQKISITNENAYDVLMKRFLSVNFERAANTNIPVYLAKLRILKKDNGYVIKNTVSAPYCQFIVSNEALYRYIKNLHGTMRGAKIADISAPLELKTETPLLITSGTERIEAEIKARNKTYFSGQIAHGLGAGDVIVHVGVVDLTEESAFIDDKRIILGDSSILVNTPFEPLMPAYNTAVILYPEKQTFRIAVKMLSNLTKDEITVKWWAIKNDDIKETNYAEADGVTVNINEKSVSLAPREKFKFTAVIEGTDSKECKWSVTDNDGGEIDINGVYQAPDSVGVYQIMAQSVKYPHKKAVTFVVVK